MLARCLRLTLFFPLFQVEVDQWASVSVLPEAYFIFFPLFQVEVDQWAGVSALPENRVLGDIAHLYRQGEDAIPPQLLVPTGATVCRRHPHRDPSALFCWDCKVTVCDQCVSEDHQGGSHNVRIITDCVREEKVSNSQSTELFNLKFQSLEVVSRYRDTQLQVSVICEI